MTTGRNLGPRSGVSADENSRLEHPVAESAATVNLPAPIVCATYQIVVHMTQGENKTT